MHSDPQLSRSSAMRSRVHVAAIGLLLVGLVAGCGTIPRAAFEEFHSATAELRSGSDVSLEAVVSESRERFLAGESGDILSLMLETVPGDPFTLRAAEGDPLFLSAHRFRGAVHQLNTALVDYAALLAQLASAELLDPAEFDLRAEAINDGLRRAAATVGVAGDRAKEIGLISSGASAMLRAHLERRQRNALAAAIRTNREAIAAAAQLGAEATRLTAAAVRNEYDLRSTALALADDRVGLLALNASTIARLEVLRRLHAAYAALPAAHGELAASIERSGSATAMIRELVDRVRDAQRLAKELALPDSTDSAE